jgi:putative transposase
VILFMTVCTARRQALLASSAVHGVMRRAWNLARDWQVGYYMIMPDHLHLFCGPGCWEPRKVKVWIRYWKHLVTREWAPLHGQWQADGWDTQMRCREHYLRKLEYVSMNPVRRGLVARTEDWPFQGHMGDLPWIL